ncbi:MAG: hypothetical protein Q8K72_17550, partial [Acidimicrobiales bacterium]|nr:hypothetical protein [Acidimicrobiales bacterium]
GRVTLVNYPGHMPELVDPADLVDPSEAALIIGLGSANGVSVYRRRYPDFPEPVVTKGRCLLWRRQDVERWASGRGSA